jgi:hypothetical protein
MRTRRVPAIRARKRVGQCVLPRSSRRAVLARPDGVPGREPEVVMSGRVLGALQRVWRDVCLREVGYRIAARLEEHQDVLAIGNPGSAEAYAHAPP